MKIYSIDNYNKINQLNFCSKVLPKITGTESKLPVLKNSTSISVFSENALAGFKKAGISKNKEFELKELTDEEYKKKRDEIEEAKGIFPPFEHIYTYGLNEWNVQLLEYILKNPDNYKENHDILISTIASRAWKNPNLKLQAEVILKLLKMPWLLESRSMEFVVQPIVWYTENEESAEIKMKLLDKLRDNPQIYSAAQLDNIAAMIGHIDSEEGYRLAEKIIQDPQMLEVCKLDYTYWLRQAGDKRNSNIKSAMIDKIQSKTELIERPYFKKGVIDILNTTDNENKLQLALKMLDNPIFFESESFVKSIKKILKEVPAEDDSESKNTMRLVFKIMDAVASKPELFKNTEFLDDFGDLVLIQRKGDIQFSKEQQLSNAKKNLFLIENGYYN